MQDDKVTLDSKEPKAAKNMLKGRITKQAFIHLKDGILPTRLSLILQKQGVLDKPVQSHLDNHLCQVLKDQSHPDRIQVDPGPFLFYKKSANDDQSAFKVSTLLQSPHQQERNAAIKFFVNDGNSNLVPLTVETKSILGKNKNMILGTDKQSWINPALEAYDSLENDFLLNLAGVSQCLKAQMDQGLEEHLSVILWPTYESINALDFPIQSPGESSEKIKTLINEACNKKSFCDALNTLFNSLGHLPLANPFQQLFKDWKTKFKKNYDFWTELKSWQEAAANPIADYHAMAIRLTNIGQLDENGCNELLQEIIHFLRKENEKNKTMESEMWSIRLELAHHYLYILESSVVFGDGEILINAAWWIANKVATVFGTNPDFIRHFRDQNIKPALNLSQSIWQLTNPTITKSAFRYGTLATRSIWAQSLLNHFTQNVLKKISKYDGWQDCMAQLDDAFKEALIIALPLEDNQLEQIYTFDRPIRENALALAKIQGEAGKELLEIADFQERISKRENVLENLQGIAKLDKINQQLTANALFVMVSTQETSEESIWEIITDTEWRKDFFSKVESDTLGMTFRAFNELMLHASDNKWRYHLPHMFAIGCEHVLDDDDRRNLLFFCTVMLCSGTDSVSAIERLLNGKNRHYFHSDVDKMRKSLESIQKLAPQLAAGRMRALLAILHF